MAVFRSRNAEMPTWYRGLAIAIAAVLLLTTVGLLNEHRAQDKSADHPVLPPPPSALTVQPDTSVVPLSGTPIDIASNGPYLYVLTSRPEALDELVRIGPTNRQQVLRRVLVADTSYRIILDGTSGRVWLLQHGPQPALTTLKEFDPLTLKMVHEASAPALITNAVALRGRLYLAAASGIYGMSFDDTRSQKIAVFGDMAVSSMVADPTRDQLIALSPHGRGSTLAVLDAEAGTYRSLDLDVQHASLALVFVYLWVAGTDEKGTPLLVNLDPQKLRITSSVRLAAADPVPTIWAGDTVIWISGTRSLVCRDARTGNTLTVAPNLTGPVVPSNGYAYSLGPQFMRALDLSRTRCYQG
ncbi:hypothetical protein ACSMXN_22205 [Jatrophihabitans sp. DSM 45814]